MSAIDRSRLPQAGPDPVFRFPRADKRRLSNGLDVWTVERPGLSVLTLVVLIRAGASADPADFAGLAALTGDLLDEGSDGRSALDMQDALARIGSELNTEVGPDATMLVLTTLGRFSGRALDLLSAIVTRPDLSEPDFGRVRELRVNRLRQLREMPPAIADHVFLRELYPGHPYGHLPIGTGRGLERVSLDHVREFHRARFRPGDATVIAVGDLSREEMAERVAQAFGGWAPGAGMTVDDGRASGEPASSRPRLLVVDRLGAAQSEIRIGRPAATRRTPDYHALQVLNMALGGQFVSRVNMNLRQDKGYTYGARTSFDCRRLPGPFTLQASVHTAVTPDAIREALAEVSAVRGSRPLDDEEIRTARASLTKGFPRNFETAEQVGRSLAQVALYDLPDETFEQFVPAVEAVTSAEATEAARRYLAPDEMIVTVVGDLSAFGDRLAPLGLGEATLVPGLD